MDDIKVNQNPKLGSLDRPNSYIGRSLPRENAKKHLDGGGQFVDDLTLPRMVHVAFLRSPFAHAEIKSINTNEAKKSDGVVDVFTANEIDEVEVECLPGPTAFVPALVSSGLPCDRFSFEGFLPVKKGRTKRLKELSTETKTMVFYESPHRILKTLNDLSNYFDVESQISVSRELTKLYEETFRGTIKESVEHFEKNKTKGEFVIVLSPK